MCRNGHHESHGLKCFWEMMLEVNLEQQEIEDRLLCWTLIRCTAYKAVILRNERRGNWVPAESAEGQHDEQTKKGILNSSLISEHVREEKTIGKNLINDCRL